MMENNTTFKFTKENYNIQVSDVPISFTVSSDGSNAIIATKMKLSLLYFKKFFSNKQQKRNLKPIPCQLFKNAGPIKMHPFFDEKEYFAGSFERNIFVYKVSKNTLNEERKYFNQHSDNITNICWQNCLNGILASFSTDKLINFYDVKYSKSLTFSIKEDEQIKSIEFCFSKPNLLAVGYLRKIKIFDLNKIPKMTENLLNTNYNSNGNTKEKYFEETEKILTTLDDVSDISDARFNISLNDSKHMNTNKQMNEKTKNKRKKYTCNNNNNNNNNENTNKLIYTKGNPSMFDLNNTDITVNNNNNNSNNNNDEITHNVQDYASKTNLISLYNTKNTYSFTNNNNPNNSNEAYKEREKININSSKNAPIINFFQPIKTIKDIFLFSSVDIINWYTDDTYLVVGSKNEAIVKIINHKDGVVEGEINLNSNNKPYTNKIHKLIKCYFMKGDLVLSITESKIYVHLFNRFSKEIVFNQNYNFENSITGFKLMTPLVGFSYLVYTDSENYFNVLKFNIEANVVSLVNSGDRNDKFIFGGGINSLSNSNIGNFGYGFNSNVGNVGNVSSVGINSISNNNSNMLGNFGYTRNSNSIINSNINVNNVNSGSNVNVLSSFNNGVGLGGSFINSNTNNYLIGGNNNMNNINSVHNINNINNAYGYFGAGNNNSNTAIKNPAFSTSFLNNNNNTINSNASYFGSGFTNTNSQVNFGFNNNSNSIGNNNVWFNNKNNNYGNLGISSLHNSIIEIKGNNAGAYAFTTNKLNNNSFIGKNYNQAAEWNDTIEESIKKSLLTHIEKIREKYMDNLSVEYKEVTKANNKINNNINNTPNKDKDNNYKSTSKDKIINDNIKNTNYSKTDLYQNNSKSTINLKSFLNNNTNNNNIISNTNSSNNINASTNTKYLVFYFKISLDLMIIKFKVSYNITLIFDNPEVIKLKKTWAVNNQVIEEIVKEEIPSVEVIENNNEHIFIDNSLITNIMNEISKWKKIYLNSNHNLHRTSNNRLDKGSITIFEDTKKEDSKHGSEYNNNRNNNNTTNNNENLRKTVKSSRKGLIKSLRDKAFESLLNEKDKENISNNNNDDINKSNLCLGNDNQSNNFNSIINKNDYKLLLKEQSKQFMKSNTLGERNKEASVSALSSFNPTNQVSEKQLPSENSISEEKTNTLPPLEKLLIMIYSIIESSKKEENDIVQRCNPSDLTKEKNTNFTSDSSTNNALYIKTISFCWSPDNNITFFKHFKLDHKSLKQNEKLITNSNQLQDWINFVKSGDNPKTSKNKLLDEDDNIVSQKLRNLVDYKSPLNIEEFKLFDLINKNSISNENFLSSSSYLTKNNGLNTLIKLFYESSSYNLLNISTKGVSGKGSTEENFFQYLNNTSISELLGNSSKLKSAVQNLNMLNESTIANNANAAVNANNVSMMDTGLSSGGESALGKIIDGKIGSNNNYSLGKNSFNQFNSRFNNNTTTNVNTNTSNNVNSINNNNLSSINNNNNPNSSFTLKNKTTANFFSTNTNAISSLNIISKNSQQNNLNTNYNYNNSNFLNNNPNNNNNNNYNYNNDTKIETTLINNVNSDIQSYNINEEYQGIFKDFIELSCVYATKNKTPQKLAIYEDSSNNYNQNTSNNLNKLFTSNNNENRKNIDTKYIKSKKLSVYNNPMLHGKDNNENNNVNTDITIVSFDVSHERKYILENLKVKLLRKDEFFELINMMLLKMNSPTAFSLLEILNIINYYINSIQEIFYSNSNNPYLIKHQINQILSILRTLEKQKYFSFIFVTVLLIVSRMGDSLIKSKLIIKVKKQSQNTETRLHPHNNSAKNVILFKDNHKNSLNLTLFEEDEISVNSSATPMYFKTNIHDDMYKKNNLSTDNKLVKSSDISNKRVKKSGKFICDSNLNSLKNSNTNVCFNGKLAKSDYNKSNDYTYMANNVALNNQKYDTSIVSNFDVNINSSNYANARNTNKLNIFPPSSTNKLFINNNNDKNLIPIINSSDTNYYNNNSLFNNLNNGNSGSSGNNNVLSPFSILKQRQSNNNYNFNNLNNFNEVKEVFEKEEESILNEVKTHRASSFCVDSHAHFKKNEKESSNNTNNIMINDNTNVNNNNNELDNENNENIAYCIRKKSNLKKINDNNNNKRIPSNAPSSKEVNSYLNMNNNNNDNKSIVPSNLKANSGSKWLINLKQKLYNKQFNKSSNTGFNSSSNVNNNSSKNVIPGAKKFNSNLAKNYLKMQISDYDMWYKKDNKLNSNNNSNSNYYYKVSFVGNTDSKAKSIQFSDKHTIHEPNSYTNNEIPSHNNIETMDDSYDNIKEIKTINDNNELGFKSNYKVSQTINNNNTNNIPNIIKDYINTNTNTNNNINNNLMKEFKEGVLREEKLNKMESKKSNPTVKITTINNIENTNNANTNRINNNYNTQTEFSKSSPTKLSKTNSNNINSNSIKKQTPNTITNTKIPTNNKNSINSNIIELDKLQFDNPFKTVLNNITNVNQETFNNNRNISYCNDYIESLNMKEFNLLTLFPKWVLVTFCDVLYIYSTELYRLGRMNERAQVEKFLKILSESLQISKKYSKHDNIVNIVVNGNSNCNSTTNQYNYNYNASFNGNNNNNNNSNNNVNNIKKNNFSGFSSNSNNNSNLNLNNINNKKNSVNYGLNGNNNISFSENRIKNYFNGNINTKIFANLSNKSIFKTDKNGNILRCDYCGEWLKLGDFTISNSISGVQSHFFHSKTNEES